MNKMFSPCSAGRYILNKMSSYVPCCQKIFFHKTHSSEPKILGFLDFSSFRIQHIPVFMCKLVSDTISLNHLARAKKDSKS